MSQVYTPPTFARLTALTVPLTAFTEAASRRHAALAKEVQHLAIALLRPAPGEINPVSAALARNTKMLNLVFEAAKAEVEASAELSRVAAAELASPGSAPPVVALVQHVEGILSSARAVSLSALESGQAAAHLATKHIDAATASFAHA